MKKIYLLLFILFALTTNAQIKVTISSGVITIDDAVANKDNISIAEDGGIILKSENLCDDNKGKEQNKGKIYYVTDCDKGQITFYPKKGTPADNAETLYYCKDQKKFTRLADECKKADATTTGNRYKDITQIPFPRFQAGNNDQIGNIGATRYLFVDAHPNHNKKINNTLYKSKISEGYGKTDEFDKNFKKAAALPVNGSLTVFIRNYNFHDLEKVTVSINGEDYNYTRDISYIFDRNASADSEGTDGTPTNPASTGETLDVKNARVRSGLDAVLVKLNTYKYLNINDLYILEKYKAALKLFYDTKPEDLTPEAKAVLDQILVWYPEYTSLTPISGIVPENDEVEIALSIKNMGKDAEEQIIGRYRTTGGITFGLGSMLYITNLKNNDVYVKTVSATEKVAAMNSENQLSLGIGLNGEVFFRTGYLVRPTLNVGFFVPFDEDLTPIVGMGPGISIAAKNIKLSFSYGISFGKINAIKEEYKGVNLETLEEDVTAESLTEKVWKIGNYFGVGLRFNIFESSGQNN